MPKIFETLDKCKGIYDKLYSFLMTLCKLLLIADILITSMSIVGRYVSFIPDPAWTEEIVLILMSYMAVLSAALAIKRNAHIRMTAFDRYLPANVVKTLDVVADVAVLILGIIMLVVGMQYALTIGLRGKLVSLPTVSKFWQYFPIPLAGFFMIVFELEQIVNHLKAFWIHNDRKEEA
ncbi:MAG: TRAP transporter small permease [Lachnospiraceae bacterium]|jgi:TRAP-type C4-dicarboxylate transport system permease small subunit|nr:TRAP transporter small permease [Lachnospiraceae bacterium]